MESFVSLNLTNNNDKGFVRVYSYLVLRHLDIPKIYAFILTDKKDKALKPQYFVYNLKPLACTNGFN
ncbi:hypothetical protein OIG_05028 [Enterococcus faecium EnGen0028]|nr:hypothetical protein OIG_05028 [Enterococcus faecium EnGen0028]